MATQAMKDLVESQAQLLGPGLYEAMSIGVHDANQRAAGLDHARYPHLRPLITRATVREHLESEGLPGGWRIAGNPCLMGQLYLSEPAMNLQLRVLKERRRTYPGGVPTAGLNPTRRRAWQGQLPIIDSPSSTPPTMTELLLLWDYTSPADQETGFILRIVHPTEPGDYGRAVRCDLDLAVQPGGTIFTQLFFSGDPDELDFFAEVDESNETGSGE